MSGISAVIDGHYQGYEIWTFQQAMDVSGTLIHTWTLAQISDIWTLLIPVYLLYSILPRVSTRMNTAII